MKKALSFLLSFLMVAGNVAFAIPAISLDHSETAAEDTAQAIVLADNSVKPGLNVITGTADAAKFDNSAEKDSFAIASEQANYKSYDIKDVGGAHGNVLSFERDAIETVSNTWSGISIKNTAFDGTRKYRFKIDWQFNIPAATDNKGAWWGGFTYITENGGHKTWSGEVLNQWISQTFDIVPVNGYSPNFRFHIGQTGGDTGTSGALSTYLDNVAIIPYYKAIYYANDGTDTVAKTEQFLYDSDGNLLTTYTPDSTFKLDDKYKYEFLGWSTDPEATEPSTSAITLKNEDVQLYAVWKEDTSIPDETTLKWDFETEDSRTWSVRNGGYTEKYENGMYIVDTTNRKNNSYIAHSALGDDTVTNTKALRYLVVKARSKGTDNNIKFYFSTSTQAVAEAATVNIKIDANSKVFKEYYVDMTSNALWTGDYKSCMLQINGGSGITEIEEIYFTTNYDTTDKDNVNSFNVPFSYFGGDWGATKFEDGVLTKGEAGNGATNINLPSTVSVPVADYPILVFKCLESETNLTSMDFYWSTRDNTEYAESKKFTVSAVKDGDGYVYFYADISSNKAATGNYNSFMIVPNGANTTAKVDSVYFTNKFEIKKSENYVWDFEDGTAEGIKAWSGHTSCSVEDGKLVITRVQHTSASGGLDLVPQSDVSAAGHQYLVLKIVKDETAQKNFQVYYVTGSMSNISGNGYVHTTVKGSDADYYYAVADFTTHGSTYASGNIKKFVAAPTTIGTVKVEDVIITNDISFITNTDQEEEKEAEKVYLDVTSSKIDTDHGTVTVSPYIRYTDGSEETDFSNVQYITDSVCAQVKKNADGTATVTAQQNGTVNITIILPDGLTTLSTAIVITNQAERIAANSFKALMFGNSIRGHGYAESIGWYGTGYGMAASSEDKDYAHRFIYYMNKKYGDGVASLTPHGTPAGFEAAAAAATEYNPEDFETYVDGFLSYVKNYKPDIITIQLGENGGEAQSATVYASVMAQVIKAMQEEAPNAVIVISTPFWSSNTSNKVVGTYAAAKECGIRVAPVNTLGNTAWNADNKNMAFDAPWATDKTSNGVKAHPGDLGMDNIAKMFFEQVNITLSANERTEYTTVPNGINITTASGEAKITEAYGKLQLTAAVLPSDAAQGVEWSVDNKDIATVDSQGLVSALNNGKVKVKAVSKYVSTVYSEIEIEISGQTTPYTVTYDKNTTDEVTGMPAPNTLAKKDFVFDAVYPVRKTYRFLGWSLKADGTEADVVSGADITENTTVYAIWEKAYRWTFDRDGFKEEFTVENGFNEYVINGYFSTIATGTDKNAGVILKIKSPVIEVNPADYYALTLRMKSSEAVSTSTVEMTIKTTNGDKVFTKAIPNTDYFTYEFKLDGVTGTITGFEFKPTDVDTTIYIDNIAFEKAPAVRYDDNAGSDAVTGMPASEYAIKDGKITLSTAVPTRKGHTFLGWARKADSKLLIDDEEISVNNGDVIYAVWDKNDHWEFDSKDEASVGNAETVSVEDGILKIVESAGSNDITVAFSKDKSYDVSTTSKKIISRVKYDFGSNSGEHQQLFFMTSDSPNLSESNSAHGAKYGNAVSNDFIQYTIDLSYSSNFTGTLNKFRWDPFQCTGTFYADYFRFSDSEANIVTANGETRKMSYSDDWGTYIVRKGGKLAPAGEILIKNIALSGDIDMTDGYIVISGNAEFAENANYAVYTLDTSKVGADENSYMFIPGYDKPVTMTNGKKYIVKLDENGCGMIVFANKSDSSKHTVVKVTTDGATVLPNLVTKIRKERFVRVADPESIRFTAYVSIEARNATVEKDGYEIAEYGFIVSTEKQISSVEQLTLSAVKDGKAVKGVAYNGKNGNIDRIHERTADGIIMSAILTGMPATKEAYTTTLYLRPYFLLTSGDAVYGSAEIDTIYNSAKLIALTMKETDEYYDYINGILNICK